MSHVVMRRFRARPNCRGVVAHCLVRLASATIRRVAGTTVSIFCVENDPREFVWLGDCGEERDFAHLGPLSGAIIDWLHPNLAVSPTARTLCLVEEYHRSRPAPYQVWAVDIQAPGGGGIDLGDELRAVRSDPRVVGGALYRSHDDLGTVVLFLGLAWGVTPSGIGFSAARLGRASIAGTLSLAFDLFRLACDPRSGTPGTTYVHIPGWMRCGVATRAMRDSVASPWAKGDHAPVAS